MIENALHFPILTILILLPILGAVILVFIPKESKDAIRSAVLGITMLEFLISIILLFYFDTTTYKMQFVEKATWIPGIGADYFLGIDGISLVLILLTTLFGI
ncbi:MAG: Fe-S-binding domain-containing protein, partial [Deltaproteobacteria bacterium]